jgi:hypothetical protein
MGDWMPIDKWEECVRMARPNEVFEVMNAAGESVLTPCIIPFAAPVEWKHPPQRFRVISDRPRHSSPLPPWRAR